ncbi:MAG: aminomethyl-transferring glycine dehydrogenase [Myxococcota bacterium]|nr:aminomethyl-transferring glycine dehydrogenase [Myxococcota bacterium]
MTDRPLPAELDPSDTFSHRHIGPRASEIETMLETLGFESLEALIDSAVPRSIRLVKPLSLDGLPDRALGEAELLEQLAAMASENQLSRSWIGMGYSDTIVPGVIQRNVLENPGWYTQYTPYQAEISQGRLEALLVFQTMVSDLTGLPLANASLLDEATAAAEAMAMCNAMARQRKSGFFVAESCHPQTLNVVRTRAEAVGLTLHVGDPAETDLEALDLCGLLLQYPASDGQLEDPRALIERAQSAGIRVVMAADLLALTLVESPGTLGADIAVGSTQRFGVPLGFGGPHAAYLATKKEHARKLPGRLVGVSQDAAGRLAYRLAIQTREQHIRRDKATSNICTAQVLLAIMAGMYAVYHGPDGLRRIAERIHRLTHALATGLRRLGHEVSQEGYFDTVTVRPSNGTASEILATAWERGINLRPWYRTEANGVRSLDDRVGIAFDETTTPQDVLEVLECFGVEADSARPTREIFSETENSAGIPKSLQRTDSYLQHPVFQAHRSETGMLRYLHRLESKDLSLNTSMIPLGSCTMKLNPTASMVPITWPEFGRMHPYAPADQCLGYQALLEQLETWLGEITGLPAVSLQPNAGSQGEFAGLLAIRRHHQSKGHSQRTVCLIPTSAHGTNAASAVIAGFECVAVRCDERGNVEVADLKARCAEHADRLGALMITYPSTHGVFEEGIGEICHLVHEHGGQVYMDGANLNAQVGLTSPGEIGADVCHVNLHKTFSIPHGGGGPGMGPICAAEHLRPHLPDDPVLGEAPVSAAPYGSAGILPISWVYIALMGASGLTRASQTAILNANYMARRLSDHFDVLYRGTAGLVAHEFIIDCRGFERTSGVSVEDIAKRLMDYGFHAPTMSFPVAGTLMIEPTESESLTELDRLCDALISIRGEIAAIESGDSDEKNNPLAHAPHTAQDVTADHWPHPYSREAAAWPSLAVLQHKYWPPVSRIDNAWGDRNLETRLPDPTSK